MEQKKETASDKIMERLRKLMAQEEGERALGNLEAAALFAEKIQEQLTRHKLSLTDVESYEQDRDNPFAHVLVSPPQWGERWKPRRISRIENLADTIARAHFCRLMMIPNKNCVIFVGRKTDADIAAYVWRRLARTAWDLCEREREAAKKKAQRSPGARWAGNKEFRYNFYWGFTLAISERYQAQKQTLEIEAGNCQALVRAERDVELYVEKWTEQNGTLDEVADQERLNREAWARGYRRGQEVNLKADALNSAGEEAKQLPGGVE
jgi:hypothetical protein